MRLIALSAIACLLAAEAAAQDRDPAAACIDAFYASKAYEPIRSRIAESFDAVSPEAMTDPRKPSKVEREAVAAWVIAFQKCAQEGANFRATRYPPEFNYLLSEVTNRGMLAAVDLFDRKLTFGQFNRKLFEINQDFRRKVEIVRAEFYRQAEAAAERDKEREIGEARERQLAQQRDRLRQAEVAQARERSAAAERARQQALAEAREETERQRFRDDIATYLNNWRAVQPVWPSVAPPATAITSSPLAPQQTFCRRIGDVFHCTTR